MRVSVSTTKVDCSGSLMRRWWSLIPNCYDLASDEKREELAN
jgi:hypothetical protein